MSAMEYTHTPVLLAECLEALARSRGFLQARGQCDTERMARVLLDEFRSAAMGRITLERIPQ